MSNAIDINCDMGESFGAYHLGRDDEAIRYISSANIACGFHASDPMVMARTVSLCRDHNVGAGAHPGYPDLLGFGRRSMDISVEEMVNYVVYQVGALKGFLELYDLPLQHIKLHGALYNKLAANPDLFLQLIRRIGKPFGNPVFLTLATRRTILLKENARREGLRVALEAFPDRQYTDEGELAPRVHANVVLSDPEKIAERAVTMVTKKGIVSLNGRWLDMAVDTVCIHGDNPLSIAAAKMMAAEFAKEGMQIRPLGEIIAR